GREDHDGTRVAGENALQGLQEHALFLVVDGAPADQDRPGTGGFKALAKVRHQRRWVSRLQLELQVSCDFDSRFGCAQLGESRLVLVRLCEKQVDIANDVLEPPAQACVSADGTVGNPRVDDCYRGAAAFGKTQEVGPEFRFGNDDESGPQRVEIGADRKSQIDGEVENTFAAEAGASEPLSGIGRCGDHDAIGRPSRSHLFDQAADRQNLSYGNRVYPDGRLR